MQLKQKITLTFTALLVIVAAYLAATRGGLIAWALLIAGGLLLLKTWRRPAGTDLVWSVGIASAGALLWGGTFYYVISTWESGEVVELVLSTADGAHTARVWTMEVDGASFVYYDAPPAAAEALLVGVPLQLSRNGVVSTRIPEAREADSLDEAEADRILTAMTLKYGDRVGAADLYYLMLGRPGDRVAVIAKLVEPL